MILMYKDQERNDAQSAILIAESLRKEGSRWSIEGTNLKRDDGFEFTVFMPYENRLMYPRWIDRDAYRKDRLAAPPRLAAYVLKAEVRRWMKEYGGDHQEKLRRLENPYEELQRTG